VAQPLPQSGSSNPCQGLVDPVFIFRIFSDSFEISGYN
jgi:hypothetical protein